MTSFLHAGPIIQRHPHPAFEKLTARGYDLWYQIEDEDRDEDDRSPSIELLVEVRFGDRVIGKANFTDDGYCAYCQNVKTEPNFQRQGVATAIYVFAEAVLNRKLTNYWGDDPHQSADAKALWATLHRPFGAY